MKLIEDEMPRAVDVGSPWLAPFDGSLKADEMKSAAPRSTINSGGRLKKLRGGVGANIDQNWCNPMK